MEIWAQIRQMYFNERISQRTIARRLGIHRSTVKRAIERQEGLPYRRQRAYKSVLDPFKAEIRQMIETNAGDIMATVIYDKLASREDLPQLPKYRGSYPTLLLYVRKVKAALRPKEAFLRLETAKGFDAQCDWGKVDLRIAGEAKRLSMFVLKLSYSRYRFAKLFFLERQECFFAGHIGAFEYFGGFPQQVTYDNLTTAVFKVLSGQNRIEQDAFLRFRGQFPFEANFAAPRKGNEKGKVESDIKYIRSHAFGLDKEFASLEAANEHLLRWLTRDSKRVHTTHRQVICDRFAAEKPALRPLPAVMPQPCRVTHALVNKFSFVNFETNRYSVPTDAVGNTVTVKAFPNEVVIADNNGVIARHQRLFTRQSEQINPYHFLPLLEKKARAVDSAVVMKSFPLDEIFYRLKEALSSTVENPNRQWIRVLRLTERYPLQTVRDAIEMALVHGVCDYASITNIVRQLTAPVVMTDQTSCVDDYPQLANITVIPHALTSYDALLLKGGQTHG